MLCSAAMLHGRTDWVRKHVHKQHHHSSLHCAILLHPLACNSLCPMYGSKGLKAALNTAWLGAKLLPASETCLKLCYPLALPHCIRLPPTTSIANSTLLQQTPEVPALWTRWAAAKLPFTCLLHLEPVVFPWGSLPQCDKTLQQHLHLHLDTANF